MRWWQRSRPGTMLLVSVLVGTAHGCADVPPRSVRLAASEAMSLHGVFVPARSLTLVPDRYWEAADSSGGWSFSNAATLSCYVADDSGRPLQWRLETRDGCEGMHFEVTWDGAPLVEGPIAAGEGGAVELTVPGRRAGEGLHVLGLRRVYQADDADLRGQHDNRFRRVTVRRGPDRASLRRRQVERYRRLDDFLSLGLTGWGERKRPGCLVEGSARLEAKLRLDQPGMLEATAENLSTRAATFTLRSSGEETSVRLRSGEAEQLTIAVDRGGHEVTLEVAGHRDGLHLWGAPRVRSSQADPRPPVILVTLDTTRRDALSVHGAAETVTPNLSSFAETAMVFDSAWATSPWTLPTHATLFTGLYPSHHGAGVSDDRLLREHVSLAEVLLEHGYETVGVVGGHLASSRFGLGQGFLVYQDPEGFEVRGDRVTDVALELVAGADTRSLFVFMNYFDPHGPYQAPEPFASRFDVPRLAEALSDLPYWAQMLRGDVRGWLGIIKGEAPVTDDALRYARAAYTAEVAYMDHQIGRLFAGLRRVGLYEDALIIVVADHGELLGEGGHFSHGSRLDPELTWIPMMIKLPGQQEGRRRIELVSQVDVWATVLDVLGVDATATDGLSLRDPEGTVALDRRATVFMEEHESRIHPLFESMSIADHLYAVQRASTREVVWAGGIGCSRLTAAGWVRDDCTTAWRERLNQLSALADVRLGAGDRGGGEAEAGLATEDEQALRALGYLE